MSKKLILIETIVFLVFVVFFLFSPIAKADATQVYVGIKLEGLENPNVSPWCLPDGTKMSILEGETVLNTVTLTVEACKGDTIWSGLVDITSGNTYKIQFDTFWIKEFSYPDWSGIYLACDVAVCDYYCYCKGYAQGRYGVPYCESCGAVTVCTEAYGPGSGVCFCKTTASGTERISKLECKKLLPLFSISVIAP